MEKLRQKINKNIYKKESFFKSFYTSFLLIKLLVKNKNYKELIIHLSRLILVIILLLVLTVVLLVFPAGFIYYLVDTIKNGYVFKDFFMMLFPLFLLLGSIEYLVFLLFFNLVVGNSKHNLYLYSNLNML